MCCALSRSVVGVSRSVDTRSSSTTVKYWTIEYCGTVCVCGVWVMCPAAVVLVMPVAIVAVPRDADHHHPLSSSSSSPTLDVASDASYPVPSLPLHHARSCFRVYQRGQPSPLPSTSVTPPTASDNEVSDLLRDCAGVDDRFDLLHYHQRHRHRHLRHHRQFSVSCDRARWHADVDRQPWQSYSLSDHVDAADRLNDDELVHSGDLTVHATSVMNALYRPSLDFNKMQVSYALML